MAQSDGLFAHLAGDGAHRTADTVHALVIEILVGDTADIVGAKDMGRKFLARRSVGADQRGARIRNACFLDGRRGDFPDLTLRGAAQFPGEGQQCRDPQDQR